MKRGRKTAEVTLGNGRSQLAWNHSRSLAYLTDQMNCGALDDATSTTVPPAAPIFFMGLQIINDNSVSRYRLLP